MIVGGVGRTSAGHSPEAQRLYDTARQRVAAIKTTTATTLRPRTQQEEQDHEVPPQA